MNILDFTAKLTSVLSSLLEIHLKRLSIDPPQTYDLRKTLEYLGKLKTPGIPVGTAYSTWKLITAAAHSGLLRRTDGTYEELTWREINNLVDDAIELVNVLKPAASEELQIYYEQIDKTTDRPFYNQPKIVVEDDDFILNNDSSDKLVLNVYCPPSVFSGDLIDALLHVHDIDVPASDIDISEGEQIKVTLKASDVGYILKNLNGKMKVKGTDVLFDKAENWNILLSNVPETDSRTISTCFQHQFTINVSPSSIKVKGTTAVVSLKSEEERDLVVKEGRMIIKKQEVKIVKEENKLQNRIFYSTKLLTVDAVVQALYHQFGVSILKESCIVHQNLVLMKVGNEIPIGSRFMVSGEEVEITEYSPYRLKLKLPAKLQKREVEDTLKSFFGSDCVPFQVVIVGHHLAYALFSNENDKIRCLKHRTIPLNFTKSKPFNSSFSWADPFENFRRGEPASLSQLSSNNISPKSREKINTEYQPVIVEIKAEKPVAPKNSLDYPYAVIIKALTPNAKISQISQELKRILGVKKSNKLIFITHCDEEAYVQIRTVEAYQKIVSTPIIIDSNELKAVPFNDPIPYWRAHLDTKGLSKSSLTEKYITSLIRKQQPNILLGPLEFTDDKVIVFSCDRSSHNTLLDTVIPIDGKQVKFLDPDLNTTIMISNYEGEYLFKFKSVIDQFEEKYGIKIGVRRNVKNNHGEYDYFVEIEGRKGHVIDDLRKYLKKIPHYVYEFDNPVDLAMSRYLKEILFSSYRKTHPQLLTLFKQQRKHVLLMGPHGIEEAKENLSKIYTEEIKVKPHLLDSEKISSIENDFNVIIDTNSKDKIKIVGERINVERVKNIIKDMKPTNNSQSCPPIILTKGVFLAFKAFLLDDVKRKFPTVKITTDEQNKLFFNGKQANEAKEMIYSQQKLICHAKKEYNIDKVLLDTFRDALESGLKEKKIKGIVLGPFKSEASRQTDDFKEKVEVSVWFLRMSVRDEEALKRFLETVDSSCQELDYGNLNIGKLNLKDYDTKFNLKCYVNNKAKKIVIRGIIPENVIKARNEIHNYLFS